MTQTQILLRVIGGDQLYGQIGQVYSENSPSFQDKDSLHWIPWKTGIAFAHKGRTLLVLKQEPNLPCEKFLSIWTPNKFTLLEATWRIEVHVHTDDWIKLVADLSDTGQIDQSLSPSYITGLATRLLVMILQHVKSLATIYFPGMLVSHHPYPQTFPTYMPCWKCFAEIGLARLANQSRFPGHYVCKNLNPVYCFDVDENIVLALREGDLECAIHGRIKVQRIAPDLVSRCIVCSDVMMM